MQHGPATCKLFDEQINRLSIIAEISPQIVALKTAKCDKKNIALLSKLIDQRMLFVLQSSESARLSVYRRRQGLCPSASLAKNGSLPKS